jgi:fructose-bisphosphate aldolase, class I
LRKWLVKGISKNVTLILMLMDHKILRETAEILAASNTGILAADESTGSIEKRFNSIGVASTPENHRIYRQLLFTAPQIEKYICGVIMFDETVRQFSDDGIPFPKLLAKRGILPGIKVDKGLKDMANFPGEKIVEGLDGLRERLTEYSQMGLKFAKFRTLTNITEKLPTDVCTTSNAESQARYAALCQEANIVPIVEPEILMEGDHSMAKSKQVLRKVLKEVFIALERHKVYIKGMILKSSWVHPGLNSNEKADSKQIAQATIDIFKEVLPDDLPGVVFLSGGDNPEDSTSHLDALNEIEHEPWNLSFSFGRALQTPVMEAWAGKAENVEHAQRVFYERAELNSLATSGKY